MDQLTSSTASWWVAEGAPSDWWKDPAVTRIDDRGTADDAGPDRDDVVLVDETGRPTTSASRSRVHSSRTPRHLAFSCWVTRGPEVLLTRRALGKRAWPGVWTNAFCGHPRPGESFADAVRRHAHTELGLGIGDLEPVQPGYRYRAVDPSGIVENEICPVFGALAEGEPRPNPDEVMDLRWVPAAEAVDLVRIAPWVVSPWMAEQVRDRWSIPGAVAG